MPDNVSLTSAEINNIKQINQTLISRLKRKVFHFGAGLKDDDTKHLYLITDDTTAGMEVFAGVQSKKLTKNAGNSAVFHLPITGSPSTPNIQVTLSASNDITLYRFNTSAVYNNSAKTITVYISGAPDKKHTITSSKSVTVTVHLLVTSYA
jgi:hypothetical protein